MTIEINNTSIKDVKLIIPAKYDDSRGFFAETWNMNSLAEKGMNLKFVQENHSFSYKKGTLRGLHFQKPPYDQAKLVRCIEGEVLDIALDLRKKSNTFGQFQKVILSGENKKQFFIPRGFAHAFLVLSESAIFSYKVDNVYAPDYDDGIIWNDPNLSIDWGFNKSELIISEKDKKLISFSDFNSPFS